MLVHPPMELAKKVVEWNNAAGPAPRRATRRNVRSGGGQGKTTPPACRAARSWSARRASSTRPATTAERWALLPKEKFADYKAPPQTLPRHEDGDMDENQKNEWIAAIKGGPAGAGQLRLRRDADGIHPAGQHRHPGRRQDARVGRPEHEVPQRPVGRRWLRREYREPFGSARWRPSSHGARPPSPGAPGEGGGEGRVRVLAFRFWILD